MLQFPDSDLKADGPVASGMAKPSGNGANADVASIVLALREQAGKLAEKSKTAGAA